MSDLHIPTPEERAAFDALPPPTTNQTVAALIRVAGLGNGERLANRQVTTPATRRMEFARWLRQQGRLIE